MSAPAPPCFTAFHWWSLANTGISWEPEYFFRERGVHLVVLDDADCIEIMANFVRQHPDLWNEDIGR